MMQSAGVDLAMAERVFAAIDVTADGQIELSEWMRVYGSPEAAEKAKRQAEAAQAAKAAEEAAAAKAAEEAAAAAKAAERRQRLKPRKQQQSRAAGSRSQACRSRGCQGRRGRRRSEGGGRSGCGEAAEEAAAAMLKVSEKEAVHAEAVSTMLDIKANLRENATRIIDLSISSTGIRMVRQCGRAQVSLAGDWLWRPRR